MSKLTVMLKWAMRIAAVGGALLAIAVGTAAWMHRTQGRLWYVSTPTVQLAAVISPQFIDVEGGLRSERQRFVGEVDGYELRREDWDNSRTEEFFKAEIVFSVFFKDWHGFGIRRGMVTSDWAVPSYTGVLLPTWSLIVALLLPMGLWAGIGWQRRRVKAGHCVGCGYDLRASPEKCPECGREVKNR